MDSREQPPPTVLPYAPQRPAVSKRIVLWVRITVIVAALNLLLAIGYRVVLALAGWRLADMWGMGRYTFRPMPVAATPYAYVGLGMSLANSVLALATGLSAIAALRVCRARGSRTLAIWSGLGIIVAVASGHLGLEAWFMFGGL